MIYILQFQSETNTQDKTFVMPRNLKVLKLREYGFVKKKNQAIFYLFLMNFLASKYWKESQHYQKKKNSNYFFLP